MNENMKHPVEAALAEWQRVEAESKALEVAERAGKEAAMAVNLAAIREVFAREVAPELEDAARRLAAGGMFARVLEARILAGKSTALVLQIGIEAGPVSVPQAVTALEYQGDAETRSVKVLLAGEASTAALHEITRARVLADVVALIPKIQHAARCIRS